MNRENILQSAIAPPAFLQVKQQDMAALILRLGLGMVFLIGGLSKLSLLLSSDASAAMVASYMGPSGYINELFQNYLFSNSFITPWGFLTTLSTFELFSGIAFILGFLIRPLSIVYAFLLWSFVVALPVETVPDIAVSVKTYTSPAIMVQIRDIALSGMMFVLFNLGAGYKSLDHRLFGRNETENSNNMQVNWINQGLLLRLSLAAVFLVAGFFGHYQKIPDFATTQIILAVIALLLAFADARLLKSAAAAAVLVLLWYIAQKISLDKSLIGNLNGFKREFALTSAAITLIYLDGGRAFTIKDILQRTKGYFTRPDSRQLTN